MTTVEALLVNTAHAPDTGCRHWLGPTAHGYGITVLDGRRVHAARLVLTLIEQGDPAAYFTLGRDVVTLHLCGRRSCIEPSHLAFGNQADRVRASAAAQRGIAPWWANGLCRRLHDISRPENVYVRPTGRRECAPCRRLREMDRRILQLLARLPGADDEEGQP